MLILYVAISVPVSCVWCLEVPNWLIERVGKTERGLRVDQAHLLHYCISLQLPQITEQALQGDRLHMREPGSAAAENSIVASLTILPISIFTGSAVPMDMEAIIKMIDHYSFTNSLMMADAESYSLTFPFPYLYINMKIWQHSGPIPFFQ